MGEQPDAVVASFLLGRKMLRLRRELRPPFRSLYQMSVVYRRWLTDFWSPNKTIKTTQGVNFAG